MNTKKKSCTNQKLDKVDFSSCGKDSQALLGQIGAALNVTEHNEGEGVGENW